MAWAGCGGAARPGSGISAGLGAEPGVPGRGRGGGDPLDSAQLLSGVGGLTARVTVGHGRSAQ